MQLPFQLSFGPMQLTQVECMGNESKLLQCSHNEVGNCSQAAAVWCDGVNGMYLSIIYVCLFNHRTFKECILDSEQWCLQHWSWICCLADYYAAKAMKPS